MRKWRTILFFVVFLATVGVPNLWAQHARFSDLSHYPGGTWAEPWGINDAGVIVGMGDIASGYTRPIGVPLFGPNAGQWFDLGTLGGERTDTYVMCMDITDTGMIVGHSAITGNEIIHAFVWTPYTRMVDIGTLADVGYTGYEYSIAYGTNRSGTLIVGWSSSGLDPNGPDGPTADSQPVVWTPKVVWDSGHWKVKWQIHKLDTTGVDGFSYWTALYANNHGQIIGLATAADGTFIGVIWNPVAGGRDWKIQQLPAAPGFNNVLAKGINNNGEIVGILADLSAGNVNAEFPAYWKPTDRSGLHFSVTILPTLAGYLSGFGDPGGINDVGDIVGGSTDANGNYLATWWRPVDSKWIAKLLPTPENSGSWASKVNNHGVVTGSYWNDSVPENTVAWKLH